jgi:hypothetical protein
VPKSRVVYWQYGWCGRRVRQWVSKYVVSCLNVLTPSKNFHYVWKPRAGWRVSRVCDRGDHTGASDRIFPQPEGDAMKRRIPAVSADAPPVPASKHSVIWGKLPALRDFLTATAYEDGSTRVPGYMQVKTIGVAWQVTLYDPDSGARLPVRATELDAAFALAEQLLGVEDAQWEVDRYLSEMLAKRTKKKRS